MILGAEASRLFLNRLFSLPVILESLARILPENADSGAADSSWKTIIKFSSILERYF